MAKSVLIERNLWHAIKGEADEALDECALAAICLLVGQAKVRELIGCTTAKQAWEKLENNYVSKMKARVTFLERDFVTMRLGSLTIDQYVTKIVSLAADLRAAGRHKSNEDIKLRILFGLPARYDAVVDMLDDWPTDDSKTVDDLRSRLAVCRPRR